MIGTGEGNKRGSAHVCEEMRLERLYLSVFSDVIKTEGATPYDVAPSDEKFEREKTGSLCFDVDMVK